MSVSASIEIGCTATDSAARDLAAYSGQPRITNSLSLSSSIINKCFGDDRTIAAPETLDVTSGLTSAYGTALVYASVRAVVIKNLSGTATLTVGGGSNPLFGTDQYTVGPGVCLPITTSWAVSGGAKNILCTPSASLSYQILILGS